MSALYETNLVDDFFEPKDGHVMVEIQDAHDHNPNSTDLTYKVASLREEELAEYLQVQTCSARAPGILRVLFCAERFNTGVENVPFPMKRETWLSVATSFNLPKGFLDFLAVHASVATEFVTLDGHQGFMAMLGARGVALSFDTSSLSTSCMVIGLSEHQVHRFKSEIMQLRNQASDPRLVITIWLDLLTQVRTLKAGDRRKELEHIRLQTGMHLTKEETLLRRHSVDIDALSRQIIALWHELTWDEFALKTLFRAHTKLGGIFVNHNAVDSRGLIDIRMANIADILSSLQSRTSSSLLRANIQLQTIYNFVNQRDSQVNIEHAAASRQLAELSLHDSSVMRSIALDSNKVANLTRRDSTDMRIIAAVTLGFLPPTFIATLFSTQFFNFEPRKGDLVSSWIWVYAVVATGMTSLVLTGWYIFSKRSRRKIKKTMEDHTSDVNGLRALPETTVVTLASLPNGLPSAMRAFTSVAAADSFPMRSPTIEGRRPMPMTYPTNGNANPSTKRHAPKAPD